MTITTRGDTTIDHLFLFDTRMDTHEGHPDKDESRMFLRAPPIPNNNPLSTFLKKGEAAMCVIDGVHF